MGPGLAPSAVVNRDSGKADALAFGDCVAGYFVDGRKAPGPTRPNSRMTSEDGSGTGSYAWKPSTKLKADVNMSVLPSALPSAVKVPLKIAKVVPLPKAYKLVTKSLFALSWENSSSSSGRPAGRGHGCGSPPCSRL